MNTIQLLKDLSENTKTRASFQGVYPSNCLPKRKLKRPAFVIANTGDSTSPGEHWTGFYFPKSGKSEFFDSFGGSPLNADFREFLERNCSSYIYNKQRLQGDFSTCCGQWCCVYMYYRCAGKTLKQFLKLFSPRKFDFNDNKVVHLYHKHFEKSRKRSKTVPNQSGGRKKMYHLPYNQCCRSRFDCGI